MADSCGPCPLERLSISSRKAGIGAFVRKQGRSRQGASAEYRCPRLCEQILTNHSPILTLFSGYNHSNSAKEHITAGAFVVQVGTQAVWSIAAMIHKLFDSHHKESSALLHISDDEAALRLQPALRGADNC